MSDGFFNKQAETIQRAISPADIAAVKQLEHRLRARAGSSAGGGRERES